MTPDKRLTRTWLVLLALTLGGGFLGESHYGGIVLAVAAALLVAVKSRLVIVHFLELNQAHPRIRRVVGAYFAAMPALMVLTALAGPQIVRWTSLGG
ncbi:hypothetical protein OTERR_21490 [Oryzomicrobium terrae]|uniref:Cytochrome c oxidase subunit IV n=1 Tax=Oryzomicrobium terrae TaxID=1735038 RepID=A0A5C1EAB5_9RHOO|nr:cytochrome C oxidase subunit IV family protein [Oryzomicrobium terrae]QEL65625.1 hypothetical protein OTERR_21490 [Oryzomicrobium terrae]